jgi:hypothetical protein
MCLLAGATIPDYAPQSFQFRIRAMAWHALHGDRLSVAGYRITVPGQWLAEELTPDDAYLWNTRTGEAIWLRSFPKPSMFTLADWSDFVEERMNDARNPIVGRLELSVAEEPFVCFERNFEVNPTANASADPSAQLRRLPSVECNSAGLLDVMFFAGVHTETQQDYSKFYSLMDSIQKDAR